MTPEQYPHLARVLVEILDEDHRELLNLSTYEGWNALGDIVWGVLVIEYELDDTLGERIRHTPLVTGLVQALVNALANAPVEAHVFAPEPLDRLVFKRLRNYEVVWN